MLGVVIPTCDRLENLSHLLLSLTRQTIRDFYVVVADDGSSDGTRQVVEELALDEVWRDRLRWVGCGPNRGVRTGRARNIGVANLPAASSLVVFLDADLVLPPHALASFDRVHRSSPNSVIFGRVDWLPELVAGDVDAAIVSENLPELRTMVPKQTPRRVEGTFVGPELREDLFSHFDQSRVRLRAGWTLPLNSAWPLEVFSAVGGFDEAMVGYGFEDIELGARAAQLGVHCIPRSDVWSLHVWHPKPDRAMLENQLNLDYYLRRHGPDPVAEIDVEWDVWVHYHAERGGSIVRNHEEYWAVDRSRMHRIRLTDGSWLKPLGFCSEDSHWPVVRDSDFEAATIHDVAYGPEKVR